MANTIELGIVVDDNGSLKLVTKEAQAAGTALGGVASNAQTSDRRLKGTANASSNATKNFSKMSQGLTSGLVPAYATLAANLFAAGAAFSFLKESADYLQLLKGQEALIVSTGIGYRSLAKSLQEATANQITFTEASRATAIGLASGLSGEQLTKLGEAAFNISRTLGRDVTDSFNRLVRGVTKAEPELLDELGIVLRLDDALGQYADALGTTANKLTNYQRTQGVVNFVLQQAEERFSAINEITDPTASSIAQLGVSFESLGRQIGQAIIGPASVIADFLNKNVEVAASVLGLFASTIISSVIPSSEQLSKTTQMAGANFNRMRSFAAAAGDSLTYTDTKAKGLAGTLSSVVARSVGAFNFGINAGAAALKGMAGAFQLAQAAALRFVSFASRAIGVVGILILVVQGLSAAYDWLARKLGLVNEELEKANKAMTDTSGTLDAISADLEFMADRVNGTLKGFKGLREEIIFLGNAFKTVNLDGFATGLNQLENSLNTSLSTAVEDRAQDLYATRFGAMSLNAAAKAAKMEELRAEARDYFATNTLALTDEEEKLSDSLVRQLKAMNALTNDAFAPYLASLEDNNRLTREEREALAKKVQDYRDTGTALASLTELGKQAADAQRSLNSQYNATPYDAVIAANEQQSIALEKVLANTDLFVNSTEEEIQAMKDEKAAIDAVIQSMTSLQEAYRANQILKKQVEGALSLSSLDPTMAGELNRRTLQETRAQLDINDLYTKRQQLLNQMETAQASQLPIMEAQLAGMNADIALQETKLEVLKAQNNELVMMKNNAIKAFEGSIQQNLAALIKGQETSIKKMVSAIATATLESIADSLAKQMTQKISGFLFKGQDPATKIKNAMVDGANYFASVASRALGKPSLSGTATTSSGVDTVLTSSQQQLAGNIDSSDKGFSLKRYLIGAPGKVSVTEGKDTQTTSGRMGGIFGPFLNSLSNLFSGDAPFLKSLGGVFANGLKGFGSLFSDLLGGIFGGGGSGVLGMVGGFFGLARGGVMPRGYASGGIVKEPTFLVGEGRHNEAVVPLPDGRSIPVSMPAGAAGINNVTVNVAVDNNGNATTNTQMDDQQTGQLGKFIAGAVQEELQRQKRPGGILSPYGAA